MLYLGGGFKYFLFSPRILGEMIQFDSNFSGGLKPPTRYCFRITYHISAGPVVQQIWFVNGPKLPVSQRREVWGKSASMAWRPCRSFVISLWYPNNVAQSIHVIMASRWFYVFYLFTNIGFIFFIFTNIWGRFPFWLLTNMFQMGWNHQLDGI